MRHLKHPIPALILGAGIFLAPAASAGTITLALPIDCTPGDTCYIQQYVDRDPGPGIRDYGCGTVTYQGHDGTDFALPTRAAMEAGVAVLAAAPGRVRAVRDGEADGAFLAGESVAGKECGNGVVIEHGAGWQTQYCHLKRGSIRVKPGETVATGTPLGLVGLSGLAEFPHLHLTLRENGAPVDPFLPAAAQSCTTAAQAGLWQSPLPYTPGGLLEAGFSAAPPEYAAIRNGAPAETHLPADAGALILWAYGWDSVTGDVLRVVIEGPAGFRFAQEMPVAKGQALFFRYAGKKAPPGGFARGPYRATAELVRAGKVIGTRHATVELGG